MTVSKAAYDAVIREKDGQINALKHRLEQLERLIFAAKSERHAPTLVPEQMALWDQGADAGAVEEPKEKVSYERRKPRRKSEAGRAALPENLPVRRKVIEPDEDTTDMVKIGEDITRKVNYRPATLELVEYVRPRYARPEAEQTDGVAPIVQAPAPQQVLPKAIADTGLLVQLVIAKYIDHLPLHRQRRIYKRDHDWDIPSSTMGDWFAATCTLLKPLYDALQNQVLDTDYLQGDESRITVLEANEDVKKNKKSKSHRHPMKLKRKVHLGYMWVFRNPEAGGVLFAYRPGRGANVLHETLADFKGLLQSDGYSAYTSFRKNHPGVVLISCLAHIRRKFFDAQSNHLELAELALEAIKYLYKIERISQDYNLSAERRGRLRDRFARPAYDALMAWVRYHLPEHLPKSGIGKALGYAANHLPRLAPYLDDGRIAIDNNQIENKIRPLALGRKNYMFAGSKEGARRAAMMYSFFACCNEHDVNPRIWLLDVLPRVAETRPSRMGELLPGAWKAAREVVDAEEE